MESKWTRYFNRRFVWVDPGSVGSRQVLGQRRAAYPGTVISASPQQARNELTMLSLCSFQGCFVSVAEPSMP